ncbi:hypothetical protein BJ170DRAFT_603009 [Xylariales sp. AK1849]|nr:hypothetical protein BJ170DRAFT_603009 [Xylariales sp. AK1849]
MTSGRKSARALRMIRVKSKIWFKSHAVDDRDRALLDAEPVSFMDYTQRNYVCNISHVEKGEHLGETDWTIDADKSCMEMVSSAGGAFTGFKLNPCPTNFVSMTVNVHIQGPPGANFDDGYLSTQPRHIRVFEGPRKDCPCHPWHAMILRDCTTNSHSLHLVEDIASRKWDILAVSMCDHDNHWVVIAIRDAGPEAEKVRDGRPGECRDCGCCHTTGRELLGMLAIWLLLLIFCIWGACFAITALTRFLRKAW